MHEMRDKLANYAHSSWSNWMRYVFKKSVLNKDGSVTIPAEFVARWARQMGTEFKELSDDEQQSDIKEAYKIMDIIW